METNWIRFDPDDKLTWPEMETDYWSKAVLVCDTDHHIYIGVMRISDSRDETEWFLTNDVEDVSVPADCVTAWMPLPEPLLATLTNRRMNPYLRETHESQRGAGK